MKSKSNFAHIKQNWITIALILAGLVFRYWNFMNRIEFRSTQARDLFLAEQIHFLGPSTEIFRYSYLIVLKILQLIPNLWLTWIAMELFVICGLVGLFFLGKKLEGFAFGLTLMLVGIWSSGLVAEVGRLGPEKIWFAGLVLGLYLLSKVLGEKQIDVRWVFVIFLINTGVWRNKMPYMGNFLCEAKEMGWIAWVLIGCMLVLAIKQKKEIKLVYLIAMIWLLIVGLLTVKYFFLAWLVMIFWLGWAMWTFWLEIPKKSFAKYMVSAWFGFWFLQNREIVLRRNSFNPTEVAKTIEEHVAGGVSIYAEQGQEDISWPVAYVLERESMLKKDGKPVIVYKKGEKVAAGLYNLNNEMNGVKEIVIDEITAF